jgi:microcystin-dependent protein
MEPFLGQLMLVPYNFAPQGWAFCNGQILPISQNSALFSLLGTTYGGNGQTTFALPDLRGRVAISAGQGPGLQNYSLGEAAGSEAVTLLSTQMPAHTHLVGASTGSAQATPDNAFPGSDGSTQIYDMAASTTMSPQMIQPAGGSQPHENRQPYLAFKYIIALVGFYPSRG